jgi:hypothetical protein
MSLKGSGLTIRLPYTLEEMKKRGEAARSDLALALGNFAIRFLQMEAALDGLIHELLALAPDTGHALTSAIRSNRVRFQILAALNSDLEQAAPFRRDIETALGQADGLNEYRNWLLHDRWTGSVAISDEAWNHQKRRMRRGKWQERDFTSESVSGKADECVEVAQRISTICSALNHLRAERR